MNVGRGEIVSELPSVHSMKAEEDQVTITPESARTVIDVGAAAGTGLVDRTRLYSPSVYDRPQGLERRHTSMGDGPVVSKSEIPFFCSVDEWTSSNWIVICPGSSHTLTPTSSSPTYFKALTIPQATQTTSSKVHPSLQVLSVIPNPPAEAMHLLHHTLNTKAPSTSSSSSSPTRTLSISTSTPPSTA